MLMLFITSIWFFFKKKFAVISRFRTSSQLILNIVILSDFQNMMARIFQAFQRICNITQISESFTYLHLLT
jgi:hypothetical protein